MNNIDLIGSKSSESLTGIVEGKTPTGSSSGSFLEELAAALATLATPLTEEEKSATATQRSSEVQATPLDEENNSPEVKIPIPAAFVPESEEAAALADLEKQIASFRELLEYLTTGYKADGSEDEESEEGDEIESESELKMNAELQEESELTQSEVKPNTDNKESSAIFVQQDKSEVDVKAEVVTIPQDNNEEGHQDLAPTPEAEMNSETEIATATVYTKEELVKETVKEVSKETTKLPNETVGEKKEPKDMKITMTESKPAGELQNKEAYQQSKKELDAHIQAMQDKQQAKVETPTPAPVAEPQKVAKETTDEAIDPVFTKQEPKRAEVKVETAKQEMAEPEALEVDEVKISSNEKPAEGNNENNADREPALFAKSATKSAVTLNKSEFMLLEPEVATTSAESRTADIAMNKTAEAQPKADTKHIEQVLKWESVKDAANLARVVQQAGQNGATKLTVRLDPANLGRLEIQLTEVAGRIDAKIVASSSESKAILVSHGDAIRQQLVEKGIHIENMDFSFHDTLARQHSENQGRREQGNNKQSSFQADGGEADEIAVEEEINTAQGLYA
jgi:flagellar hook-length control protein FliK